MEPGNRSSRIRLVDIAQRLGLDVSTVSRAMRDNPRVTEALRRKIQHTAEEMGYQPDAMLSALAHYRKGAAEPGVNAAIAWINCWAEPAALRKYREFDGYWRGAERCARKFGYRLEEFVVNREATLGRVRRVLLARNIQCVLIPPHGGAADCGWVNWEDLQPAHFAVVGFGSPMFQLPVISVTCNQTSAGMVAFNEIRKRGYQRIGLAIRPYHWNLFAAGFCWAQQTHLPENLRLPPFSFLFTSIESDQARFERWLKKYRPDAIFTDNPQTPSFLEKAGLRIPRDIGVASTSVLDTPIRAGIDQKPEEIGRVAVLALISLFHDNARGIPPDSRQILVEGAWVDGASLPSRSRASMKMPPD